LWPYGGDHFNLTLARWQEDQRFIRLINARAPRPATPDAPHPTVASLPRRFLQVPAAQRLRGALGAWHPRGDACV
jgi:hypothetical protein